MADNSIVNALKGVSSAEAIPFGAATMPEGSVPYLSAMLSGLFNIPKHLIDSAKTATPGLRREDVTDIPGTSQPNDPLYHAAADTAMALGGIGAPAAEMGALGSFGGRNAVTADLKALQEAEKMRMHGMHPADVRADTGWFRTPTDGKWKFEIPDNRATFSNMPMNEGDALIGPLKAFMDHPDLYKAYPRIGDYKTRIGNNQKQRSGLFDEFVPEGEAKILTEGPNRKEIKSILLHEGQHGIQSIEEFSRGADPSTYAGLIEKGLKARPDKFSAYDFDAIKREAYSLYHKTAGEVEARNVQDRMNYFPAERAARHPWVTQDVRFRDQVIYDPVKGIVEALKRK